MSSSPSAPSKNGLYVEGLAAKAAVGSAATQELQRTKGFGGARHSAHSLGRRPTNASRRAFSTSPKESAQKQNRAFLVAALTGFLAGFFAVFGGWIELRGFPVIRGTRESTYPDGLLPDGTPNPDLDPQDPYEQYLEQPDQPDLQPPYTLQPSQEPSSQQPLQQPLQQPHLEQPPQQPELHSQQQLQPQHQPPEQQQQHPEELNPLQQPQQPEVEPPQQPQQPEPQQPQQSEVEPPQQPQQPAPEPPQQPQQPEPEQPQQPEVEQPQQPEVEQPQQPEVEQPQQPEPEQPQQPEVEKPQQQEVEQPQQPEPEQPQEPDEQPAQDEEEQYDPEEAAGQGDPVYAIPGPFTQDKVLNVVDDMSFQVMGIVASLESASETTKDQFAAEYMFVPEGTRGVRTVFEYFARLINGVRSVAPPSDAEPEAVAAHKVRSAFLIALLDATSERLRGIDERSSMVPEFWEYSAPLDEDAKTKIPYLPSSKDDRQSSGESSDVPASADVGAATEDGVQFSVFLKRLNTHVEDLSDQISEAEEKEAKSKVPVDVKRELALRFADLLGAARTRLEEDKKLASELRGKFMMEAGKEEELGSSDSERREGDGESIYGETGASAYAGELARRAQTQTECVLEEATRYLVDLEAELSNERQSGYHDRSFVNEVADYWKGAEVEKAWKSITEEEREKRAVAQRIKLSALRAVQDAVQECASRKEYVDALLLQAAIALL